LDLSVLTLAVVGLIVYGLAWCFSPIVRLATRDGLGALVIVAVLVMLYSEGVLTLGSV
jgi:hypothetical protein